jgi:hypothetical protein
MPGPYPDVTVDVIRPVTVITGDYDCIASSVDVLSICFVPLWYQTPPGSVDGIILFLNPCSLLLVLEVLTLTSEGG